MNATLSATLRRGDEPETALSATVRGGGEDGGDRGLTRRGRDGYFPSDYIWCQENFAAQEREGEKERKEEEEKGDERVEAPLIDLTSPREEEEEDMLVSFTQ